MLNEVKVRINDKNLRDIPSFSTPGSAGLDLRASLKSPLELKPGKTELIPTGMSIPNDKPTNLHKYGVAVGKEASKGPRMLTRSV